MRFGISTHLFHTERLTRDHLVQIAVGGGHHAQIDRHRLGAPDGHDFLLLEHAQERRLRAGR